MNNSKIIVVRAGDGVAVEECDMKLETLQRLVGGYIEPMYLDTQTMILMDEEARYKNRKPCATVGGILVLGDFVIVGVRNGEFCGLTEKQIKELSASFTGKVF